MEKNIYKEILGDYLADNGSIHQTSCVNTPQ